MSQIEIKQVKSAIGQCKANKKVLKALGLRGIGRVVVQKDNNCTRGMVNAVAHLIKYKLLNK
tara:strand:- start:1 stop:186 length:186 start_codon:yes stop_codon:yes gene_type:complete